MHALTVEYYEVVQLYRTIVELSKAELREVRLLDLGPTGEDTQYDGGFPKRWLHGSDHRQILIPAGAPQRKRAVEQGHNV